MNDGINLQQLSCEMLSPLELADTETGESCMLGTAVTHVFQSIDLRVGSFTLGVVMNSQWHFLGFYHVDGE